VTALADTLRALPREAFDAILAELSPPEIVALDYEFADFWARDDQRRIFTEDFTYALLLGGRRSGKTAAALEWLTWRAKNGYVPMRAITGSGRDAVVTLVEQGLIKRGSPDFRPQFLRSAGQDFGRVVWPNGATLDFFSAEVPQKAKGKGYQTDLYDDVTAWKSRARDTFLEAVGGLSEGNDTRCIITANPPDEEAPHNAWVVDLLENPLKDMIIIPSSTFLNAANLSAKYVKNIVADLETRDPDRWLSQFIGIFRLSQKLSSFYGIDFAGGNIPADVPEREDQVEVVIAVDPTETDGPTSDECGLVAMGRDKRRHVYVLEDSSGVMSTERWGAVAIDMAERWDADRFVGENNRGLALLTSVLNAAYSAARLENGVFGRGAMLPILGIQASSAKGIRASPVSQLYRAGRMHHCPGLGKLENQMRAWNPEAEKHKPRSDDRIDALVHGATYLAGLLNPGRKKMIRGGFSIPGIM